MEAERRQVTVLFADVVGFTAYSERAGEEAAYTLMRSLSKLMDEAVREYGGVVQGFTGDGVMAVFGAPVAYEDAPLRACRAALAILQRIKAAGPDLEAKHGMQPQLRIGLNSGAAVVMTRSLSLAVVSTILPINSSDALSNQCRSSITIITGESWQRASSSCCISSRVRSPMSTPSSPVNASSVTLRPSR